MTRSDLVEELASRFSQLTHRDAEYAVKTILDAMSEALVREHRIEIRGFGSFSINHRPPRMGRNPRTAGAIAPVADRPSLASVTWKLPFARLALASFHPLPRTANQRRIRPLQLLRRLCDERHTG